VRIVNTTPIPGSTRYNVVCWCGFPFTTTGDNRGVVKCPRCKQESRLRTMIQDSKATPQEKLDRLQKLAVAIRELYEKYTAVPDIERDRGEAREMGAQLDRYYAEAKAIMDEIDPRKKAADAARTG
jgi:uncharacterized coiled-coil DUF342 family protein